jgi:serine/threonine protein kinase
LAPEIFFGREVAFASDIYSLGVIIVEILTGKKEYPEDEHVRLS